ncbi:MAG: type II toxin-antitoxin system VapC family toxin [Chloroflexi bacterium]|nr:type II toxin-antitoxin system VapC family toxin [Chloroflexota bacterium]
MSVYVPDTHALLWFLAGSSRLGEQARAVFKQERAKEATMYVPAIVVAEIIWVVNAGRIRINLQQLLATIRTHYTVTPFSLDDILQLATLPKTLTIHDAMIVWEAKKRDATLITRDETIIAANVVPILW